jgi:hypothetical protein
MPRAGNLMSRYLIDAGLGAGLILALTLVFALDRDKPAPPPLETTHEEKIVRIPIPPKKRTIAVTSSDRQMDDVGRVLKQLGAGYSYTDIPLTDLADFSKIEKFDLLFVTCSPTPREWLGARIGDSERPGFTQYMWSEPAIKRIADSLHRFLAKGGTLYVSDLHFALLTAAFPSVSDRNLPPAGVEESIESSVTDPTLRDIIGPTLPLRFDIAGWYPASFVVPTRRTYLEGEYRDKFGRFHTAPLLVTFPHEGGSVIFTSFHNGKQSNTTKETELLKFLVFTAATSKTEAEVTQTMITGGFSPQRQTLLTASQGSKTLTGSHASTKPGTLQFVLGFGAEGADMELTVKGPDGAERKKRDTQTFTVEVPNAVVGTYSYTVTAHQVPYEHFPFKMFVNQK